MDGSTQNLAAQSQAGGECKTKKEKHKGETGIGQHSQYPVIDRKEKKRLKKIRTKEEQRKNSDAASLKNFRQGGFVDGVMNGDAHQLKIAGRDDMSGVESTQALFRDTSMVEAQENSSATAILVKKESISESKKRKRGGFESQEAVRIPSSDATQSGDNAPEVLENPSRSQSKKHKSDKSAFQDAVNNRNASTFTNGITGNGGAPTKKLKLKKSKLDIDIEKRQAEPKTVLCNKCGTIGHAPEDCVLGIVCFNCKQAGHDTKDCVHAKKCHICHGDGHVAADCGVLVDHTRRNSVSNTREVIMILDSPIHQPNKQSQSSSFDLDNLPNYDTFMENITADKKKESEGLIPALIRTKEAARLASLTKSSLVKSQYPAPVIDDDSSSDEEDNHAADIKSTSFIQRSSSMSERKESPIVPPKNLYRFEKDNSPSPAARVTPRSALKETRITPAKKILHIEIEKKKEKGKKNIVSKFVIEEAEISSSDEERQVDSDSDNDSDSAENFEAHTRLKAPSKVAKGQGGGINGASDSVEDVTYISSSSSPDSGSNFDSEIEEQQQVAKYTSILPPPKKETPIPPPKSLNLLRKSNTQHLAPKSTPALILPPVSKTKLRDSASTKQALELISTTPIPPPAIQKPSSAPKASPPQWLARPLARINSAIKASRASEGWDESIMGGGLKRGFAMAGGDIVTNSEECGDDDEEVEEEVEVEDEEEAKSQELKVIADDWEKNPGRVRGSVGGDDGDIVENIAYAPSYLSTKPHGITITSHTASTTFLTLRLSASSPPQQLSHLYPNELMICSVTDAKVQVTLAKTRFVVSKGGMWRVRGGEECTIRHAGKSGKEAIVVGVVVREVEGVRVGK